MKISDLINYLQSIKDNEGDLPMTWSSQCFGDDLRVSMCKHIFKVEKYDDNYKTLDMQL